MKCKCLIKRGGRVIEIKKLVHIGNILEDKIAGETYGVTEKPWYLRKGKKYEPLFFCNEGTGKTESLTGETIAIKEVNDVEVLNAHSLTNIIDGKLFQTAFRLKIDIKTLLIVLFLGGFLGTLVGLMI